MTKKIIAKISAVFLALIVGFGAPATVLAADTGGGIGGGGSGNTLTGPIYWKSIAYNDSNSTNQKTWKKFLSEAKNPNAEIESQVRGRVGNLEVCKKSKVIWYVNHNATNQWAFNFGYKPTHGSEWNSYWNNVGGSTIENPRIKIGRAATSSEVSAFKEWDTKKNGKKINKKPGYTVICSGAFLPPPDEYFTKYENSTTNSTKNSRDYNYPHTYLTDVKPQFSGGETKLQPQIGNTVLTNYGKLWNDVNSGKKKLNPTQLHSAVTAAVKKDETLQRSVLNLSPQNKAGMAEGGVLNIYEQTIMASVSSTMLTKTDIVNKCTYVRKWNSNKGEFNAPVKTTCVEVDRTPHNTVSMNTRQSTARNTGFYQLLSVHCNPEDFQALVDSDPSRIKVTNGSEAMTNGKISASAVTTKYNQAPQHLDFGDASNPNAAKKRTGQKGFYDKECGFECTPDSLSSNSQANGAKNNIEVDGNKIDGNRTGVTTTRNNGTVNSNSLEFFRDNDRNQINVDLWYPKRNAVVRYDGEKAVTTTVSRWEEGTPKPQSNSGGKFTMTAGGKTLFQGSDETKVQKNWNQEEFSNANATVLTGQHNVFGVSSTWASEQGKPQVLNIKYEYAPTVNLQMHTSNIGFKSNGAQNLGTVGTVATQIEGKCYVNYRHSKTDSQLDTTALFSENTGTGSTNNLDGQIIEGTGNISTSKDKKTNLVINFVRATTE